MTDVAMRFDMRRAPSGARFDELYPAAIEMSAWADRIGLSAVVLSEHHVTDDGYMPSPIPMAAAVAAITERIAISISAIVAPLWNPIRLAEDLATLDLLSRGRASVVLAVGYRPIEFTVMDSDWSSRGQRLEEIVRILRRAWTGSDFEFDGTTVRVLPTPFTPGGPLLMMGGSTPVAARRAARLGMGLIPSHHDPAIEEAYTDEHRRLGTTPVFVARPGTINFLHVTQDPERDWARIGPLALHDAALFRSWQPGTYRTAVESHLDTVEAMRDEGVYRICTPDEAVEAARSLPAGSTLVLHPLMGGVHPDWAWESLELFAEKVLPRL